MAELPKTLKILVSGETGSGKTYFALTFPKVVYIGTEPNGLDTARANPHLAGNLVISEEFLPSPSEEIKLVFQRLDKAMQDAYEQAKMGNVETLALDNVTFLAMNRWLYITTHEKLYGRSGELDTRGMYGNLSQWLYRFVLYNLCAFPGHVVMTCHEQKEDEDSLASVVDPTVPIVPNILGGFRNKVAGMFSASIYLGVKKGSDGKHHYYARCLKGDLRAAKNRYGLPEVIEDISYTKIMETLDGVVQQQGGRNA